MDPCSKPVLISAARISEPKSSPVALSTFISSKENPHLCNLIECCGVGCGFGQCANRFDDGP